MADYRRYVVKQVHREEIRNAPLDLKAKLKPLARLMVRAEERLDDRERGALNEALGLSQRLQTVYGFRQRLQQIYEQRSESRESLLSALQDWCVQAETTGIEALQEFARSLRGYTAQTA